MSNSTTNRESRKAAKIDKPPKPYPTFPLSPHNSGKWQKKILGKIHYFGRWGRVVKGSMQRLPGDGWAEALQLFEAQRDDLYAGRRPRIVSLAKDTSDDDKVFRIKDLCNHFLNFKLTQKKVGTRMMQDYRETTDLLVENFGKDRPVDDIDKNDFRSLYIALSKRWGVVRLGNVISRIKSVFKYAVDDDLIEREPAYGALFKRPEREETEKKTFAPEEIRAMIDGADVQLRAMILMGINCAYGNTDIARLPQSALNLETGWAEYPRPKTKVKRKAYLWPETRAALKAAIDARPTPKNDADAGAVFITPTGYRWVRDTKKSRSDDIATPFAELLKSLNIYEPGVGMYRLRHTARTAMDGCKDLIAIDWVMGHKNPTMGGRYTHGIDDSRLAAVAEHVRQWLFGDAPEGGAA